ncbi:hypothetical protein EDC01DRAFT_729291 [Geopyxis carbonaria]|nr:hypothetical protein EDC01DRAFT_729291 [Geopyxis carbonaria]
MPSLLPFEDPIFGTYSHQAFYVQRPAWARIKNPSNDKPEINLQSRSAAELYLDHLFDKIPQENRDSIISSCAQPKHKESTRFQDDTLQDMVFHFALEHALSMTAYPQFSTGTKMQWQQVTQVFRRWGSIIHREKESNEEETKDQPRGKEQKSTQIETEQPSPKPEQPEVLSRRYISTETANLPLPFPAYVATPVSPERYGPGETLRYLFSSLPTKNFTAILNYFRNASNFDRIKLRELAYEDKLSYWAALHCLDVTIDKSDPLFSKVRLYDCKPGAIRRMAQEGVGSELWHSWSPYYTNPANDSFRAARAKGVKGERGEDRSGRRGGGGRDRARNRGSRGRGAPKDIDNRDQHKTAAGNLSDKKAKKVIDTEKNDTTPKETAAWSGWSSKHENMGVPR